MNDGRMTNDPGGRRLGRPPGVRKREVALDPDGVPIDARDWTVGDWRDLWDAIRYAKAKIAARHRPTPGDGGPKPSSAGPKT